MTYKLVVYGEVLDRLVVTEVMTLEGVQSIMDLLIPLKEGVGVCLGLMESLWLVLSCGWWIHGKSQGLLWGVALVE